MHQNAHGEGNEVHRISRGDEEGALNREVGCRHTLLDALTPIRRHMPTAVKLDREAQ
jgi:hypothetical protein